MATTALPLTTKILVDSRKRTAFKEIRGQFGDGYQQIAPNGLNNKVDTWEITWGALTLSEVNSLETTLGSVGSWGILTWTPSNESSSKKFRMSLDGYTKTMSGKGNGVFSLSCKLVQVFDI